MKKYYGVQFLIILLVAVALSGCGETVKLPLSADDISVYLKNQADNGETLKISPNPAYEFEISVTDELCTIINTNEWVETEVTDDILADRMLYFDLYHLDGKTATRVAVLSNGYVVTQVFDENGFGERQCYSLQQTFNKNLFDELLDHIDSQSHT